MQITSQIYKLYVQGHGSVPTTFSQFFNIKLNKLLQKGKTYQMKWIESVTIGQKTLTRLYEK